MTDFSTLPDPEAVTRAASALGRDLTVAQAATLAGYLGLLVHWRRRINLVGPADWPTMLSDLVADSWYLADFLADPAVAALLPAENDPLCLLDFGAGAGLPGIPLRAFFARGTYVLLESRAKRAIFLGEAVDRLGLSGTRVAEGRVEVTVPQILAAQPRDTMTVCLSRAFAPWPRFLDICRALVPPPMAVLTMTGERPQERAMPAHWVLAACTAYVVGGKERYVSAFSPVVASR